MTPTIKHMRPIGIGEVLRRIVGKAVTSLLKPDIINSVGPLQLAAGQSGGCEAACHAMRELFENDESEAVLLVDATNAFNCLNRTTALLNVRHLCPAFSTYLINTYRVPCKLFLSDGSCLLSKEGSTQGDNCASGFYSVSTFILIDDLSNIVDCAQLWYADDAGAVGKLVAIRDWWLRLNQIGPELGYLPNPGKSYLIVKPQFHDAARIIFDGTGIQITHDGSADHSTEGTRHLGAAVGTQAFQQYFVNAKVAKWVTELQSLCHVARQEPQLAYCAFIFCLSKRWLYTMRTIQGISHLFQPLEDTIKTQFLPILLNGHSFSESDRLLYSLPTKYGGLGIFNPVSLCDLEFQRSLLATRSLTDLIKAQSVIVSEEIHDGVQRAMYAAKTVLKQDKAALYSESLNLVKQNVSESFATHIDSLSEKGVSSWLNTLPLKEFGFTLSKQEFTDAILMRYQHPLKGLPRVCSCSKANSIDHALICPNGGYTHMRHNQVRDLEVSWLSEVCKDVRSEPKLLPLTGEQLNLRSANTSEEARLDIVARGVWSNLDKTFFDVRVFHPGADSNRGILKKAFKRHESEKKRCYGERVIQVEKATFTPLVFSTYGGMGIEAANFHKRLASLISHKRGNSYSETIAYMRVKLRFCILRAVLTAVRGFRGKKVTVDSVNSDINTIDGVTGYT